MLVGKGICFSQYPAWFFQQGDLPCQTAVGFADPSIYRDSAIADGARNGAEAYARLKQTNLTGGQAFWATEVGTYWMGSSFREEFDTSLIVSGRKLNVLDSFVSKNIVIVLLGDGSCTKEAIRAMRTVRKPKKPEWVESLPPSREYYYSVGSAPEYYFEKSSWAEAERLARRNLGRAVVSDVKAMQKMGEQAQEIRDEQLQVTLRNIQIAARWKDPQTALYHVLARMKR
jgi:hypothetical protein